MQRLVVSVPLIQTPSTSPSLGAQIPFDWEVRILTWLRAVAASRRPSARLRRAAAASTKNEKASRVAGRVTAFTAANAASGVLPAKRPSSAVCTAAPAREAPAGGARRGNKVGKGCAALVARAGSMSCTAAAAGPRVAVCPHPPLSSAAGAAARRMAAWLARAAPPPSIATV